LFFFGILAGVQFALVQRWMRGTPETPFDYERISTTAIGVEIETPLAYFAAPFSMLMSAVLIWGLVLFFQFNKALHQEAMLTTEQLQA